MLNPFRYFNSSPKAICLTVCNSGLSEIGSHWTDPAIKGP